MAIATKPKPKKTKEFIPPRDMVDFRFWANRDCRTEKGERLDFEKRSYLKGIYDCSAEHQVFKKAAQMGITSEAMFRSVWLCRIGGISIIFTMPTAGAVSEFSQTRMNPALGYSNIRERLDIDNVGIKQIGTSFIYLRGAWNERQAISVPSDMNIHDELDRSRPDIREMYEERLSASALAWKMDISTPTIPNYGISALFNETDKREWFVKCQKCHKEQIITEEHIIDGDYRCNKCKEVLDRTDGRWRSTATSKDGIVGFHISQLMATWIPAAKILKKKEKYKFKRDYFNFVLGDDYVGGEGLANRGDILACIEKVHAVSGRAVVGVDWGNTSWYVVRKPGVIVHMGRIEGDTRTHSNKAAKIIEKFNAHAVLDFGYGDTKNKALIDKFPGRCWMCQYPDSDSGKLFEPKFDNKTRMVLVDRTRSIEESLGEIKDKDIEIFPNEELETFIQHHLSLIEEEREDKHGKKRTIIGHKGDDHFVHANNYARLLESGRATAPTWVDSV